MTNTIALWLGALIIGFFVLDHYVLHLNAWIVIMHNLIMFIQLLAFWR